MRSLFSDHSLIDALQRYFAIHWHGHHGIAHWSRVWLNGKELAAGTDADMHVIELFALFHDSRRLNEGIDDGHGSRGFALASSTKANTSKPVRHRWAYWSSPASTTAMA